MREIKFRAWNTGKNVMVYDNEDDSVDYWDWVKSSPLGLLNSITWYSNYEFMQFTWVFDNNGKEIYEGDIMRATKTREKWVSIVWYPWREWDKECNEENKYQIRFSGLKFTWGSFSLSDIFCDYSFGECRLMILRKREEHTTWYDNNTYEYFEVIGNIYENPELLSN